MEPTVTPGQAQWIVERLLADRRISRGDVQGYVADMGREIQELEEQLASLREAAGHAGAVSPLPPTEVPPPKATKRVGRRKKGSGHPRGIAGTLAVLVRSLPVGEHAAIAEVREAKGIKAAIRAAKRVAKKS